MPASLLWWSALCMAALLNVGLWAWSARRLGSRKDALSPEIYATRRAVLWLSAIYVAGCAFRSAFPMVDVPRTCLHDTPASRIFVGRMVATVAELAFSMQWVLLLREAGARYAARLIVPALVAAELFSWWAVLTQNNLFHAIENSLWTLSALVATIGVAALWREAGERGRRAIVAIAVSAAGYIGFMVSYDVPMYLGRWLAGIPVGDNYLGFGQGLAQILDKCIVVRDWGAWRQDVVWLSLYFTVAVWISILLAQAPPLTAGAAAAGQPGSPRPQPRAA
jgi:hypothetical protein